MAPRQQPLDLRTIWLFAGCSASELRTIRASLDELTVGPGKVLCEEGAIGREFFVIVEGTASVKRRGRRIATLRPGDYFGELALLDRKPRSASVISETELKILVLGQQQFNGILDKVPTIGRKLLVTMAGRVRDADAKALH